MSSCELLGAPWVNKLHLHCTFTNYILHICVKLTEINLFILIVQRDLPLKLPMKLKLSHSIFHPVYFHFRTGASEH